MISDFHKYNESFAMDFPQIKIPKNPYLMRSRDDVETEYKKEIKKIGREGHLGEYLRENGQKFTFGVLKIIFEDALAHKKKRLLKKGALKMLHRIIPMALSFFFLPLSIIAFALGFSRALDKIILPVLIDPGKNYNEFLKKMLLNSIKLLEGDYKMFMKKDWFYDAIGIDYNLKHLIKTEEFVKFAHFLADKIENEDPDKELPKKYVQNELKKWIKSEYNIDII